MVASFSDEWASTSEWATMYREQGVQVVPAHRPGEGDNWKRPLGQWLEFQNERAPDAVFFRWFHPETGEHRGRRNMGLVMGRASGGLFAIDLDVYKPGALEWWTRIVNACFGGIEPETWAQKTGGGGRQVFFRAPPGWEPPTFKTPIGVDLRGQGGFVMAPPSMHASGHIYDWEPDRGPWQLPPLDAPERLTDEIDQLREEYGGAPGGGPQRRERTEGEGAKDAWGYDVDQREEKILHAVWAAIVDMRREAPMRPPQADQEAEIQRLLRDYFRTTKTRLTLAPGETQADGLEREGRGESEFRRKWDYAMAQWDTKVAAAAAQPKPSDPFERDSDGEAAPGAGKRDKATDSTLDEPDTSDTFSLGELHGPAPERLWLVPEWIAANEVNSLYGAGALGKTLLAQQLVCAAVSGGLWLGLHVEQQHAVLAVFCEDRKEEIHRRHDAIRQANGHVFGEAYEAVHVWARYGLNNVLFSYRNDAPLFGAFHERLKAKIEHLNPGLLIIDTIRDVYGDNECDPAKVNLFLKTILGGLILSQQARGYGLTILLLGHPSVTGQEEGGSGLAGTLAWENAVRSRLYLSKPKDGGANERTLTRGKANYASSGEETALHMIWNDGVFQTIGEVERRQVRDRNLAQLVAEKVEFAWASGRPYMDRKGHERCLYSLLSAQLQDGIGIGAATALAAIHEAIEDGLIFLSRDTGKRGWRTGGK